MTVTLVLPQSITDQISAAALRPVESAGVLLAGLLRNPNGDLRLLGRKFEWVPDDSYLERAAFGLSIASSGYVPALGQAESMGAIPLWVHTHPGFGAVPIPSEHDRTVDRQIADLFRLRTGSEYYGAAIFSPTASGLAFSGHLETERSERVKIDRLWMVGDRFRLSSSWDSNFPVPLPIFDRNVRAFGSEIQQTLGALSVGIVGCGGTGSAVTEQLVRLGVRKVTLLDPDSLSVSNVARVYGSSPRFIGESKVVVLKKHIETIADSVHCETIPHSLVREKSARALAACDVVFGCTDDNAGRLVLSRLSTYALTPVFDMGVLLSSDANERLVGIDGRITTLVPGQACLVCRNRIDLARAAAELKTPDERVRLANEGYAPALGRTEPAVVAFTTLVAATAVSELLDRFIGYGPNPTPSEVLLRIHEREISTNIALPRTGHYCDPGANRLGLGETQPFLQQVWPA